jgi:hypothetical protein
MGRAFGPSLSFNDKSFAQIFYLISTVLFTLLSQDIFINCIQAQSWFEKTRVGVKLKAISNFAIVFLVNYEY